MRMSSVWPASRACTMRMYMYSTRSRERPRRRWIKGVTDTLRLKNTTGFQITRHAIYQKAIINKKNPAKRNSKCSDRQNKKKRKKTIDDPQMHVEQVQRNLDLPFNIFLRTRLLTVPFMCLLIRCFVHPHNFRLLRYLCHT